MKHPFILILSLLCASTLYGQQKTWSLGECIETGIRNNLTLRNSRIDVQKKQTTLSLSRSYLLPKLEANFQAIDYLMKPANVTTGTLLGNDFPDDPTWQKIQSMQYGVTAGIQLSVPLYNQTLLAGIKVAETLRNLSSLSHEKAVEDLTMQIGNVYYLAQASLEQQRLLDENIQRMESLCDITEAMYKGGVVLEVDLSRVQINRKSLEAQRDQYATLYEQQLNLLRFLLDLPAEEPFAVVPMPADVHLEQTTGVDSSLPELRLLTTQQELIQKQIKSVRAGYIPSLSLDGQLGAVGYQEEPGHFFHTDNEMHNWFGNSYLALSIHIPIFDGREKRLKVRQYNYDYQQAQTRFEQQRKQLDKEYDDTSLQLAHNLEVFRTQQENYRQAEEVYQVTEEKYREGAASMTELLQDEMRLRNAQSACVQAHCQCNVAQLQLLKLSGNLKELTD